MNAIDNASKRATSQTFIFRLNGSLTAVNTLQIQLAIDQPAHYQNGVGERERERAITKSETNILSRNEQSILHQR